MWDIFISILSSLFLLCVWFAKFSLWTLSSVENWLQIRAHHSHAVHILSKCLSHLCVNASGPEFLASIYSFFRLLSFLSFWWKGGTRFNNWSQMLSCPFFSSVFLLPFHYLFPSLSVSASGVIRDEFLLFRVTFRSENKLFPLIKKFWSLILDSGSRLCTDCGWDESFRGWRGFTFRNKQSHNTEYTSRCKRVYKRMSFDNHSTWCSIQSFPSIQVLIQILFFQPFFQFISISQFAKLSQA